MAIKLEEVVRIFIAILFLVWMCASVEEPADRETKIR
jgi:hypothetical protein